MYPAVRDAMLTNLFPALAEGTRALGVTALELELAADLTLPRLDGPGRLPVWSPETIADYRDHLAAHGITLCAVLTARDLGVGTPAEHVPWLAQAVEIAEALGAPAVRIDPLMKREKELAFDARVEIMVTALRGILARTPGSPVALGIENHGLCGNSLTYLLSVLDAVDDPRVGLTLDTGNFYWRGYPRGEVIGLIRLLAPRVRHTHLKNIHFPEEQREQERPAGWEYRAGTCGLAEGDLPLGAVVAMLRAVGYRGALCIENEALGKLESDDDRRALLQSDAAHVRVLIEA